MNVINCRSPYSIVVNEANQVSVKLEIFVWNKPSTQPATPSYILEKKILSTNNRSLDFNISNVIAGFIKQTHPLIEVYVAAEQNKMWCNVVVKKYYSTGGAYILLSPNFTAVGIYGYTRYTDGFNEINTSFQQALTTNKWNIYYSDDKGIPYINYLVDHTGSSIRAKYQAPTGAPRYLDITTPATPNGIYNFKVPIVDKTSGFVWDKCQLTIYNVVTTEIYHVFNSENLCEPKYDPIVCAFVNKFGGWEFLTFFKNNTISISAKGTDYNLLPDALDYNIFRGQSKRFNLNGTKKIVCNTGWVDEEFSEIIEQLYLSETILLDDKPVVITNQSTSLKTYMNDKNINYQIEFEYAFNLVNNVV